MVGLFLFCLKALSVPYYLPWTLAFYPSQQGVNAGAKREKTWALVPRIDSSAESCIQKQLHGSHLGSCVGWTLQNQSRRILPISQLLAAFWQLFSRACSNQCWEYICSQGMPLVPDHHRESLLNVYLLLRYSPHHLVFKFKGTNILQAHYSL